MATVRQSKDSCSRGAPIDALREPWGSTAKRYPVTRSFRKNPQNQPFRPPGQNPIRTQPRPFRPPARSLIKTQNQPFRPSGKSSPQVGRVPANPSPPRSGPRANSVSPPNGFSRTWSPTRDSPDPTVPSNASFAVSKKKRPSRFVGWKSTWASARHRGG